MSEHEGSSEGASTCCVNRADAAAVVGLALLVLAMAAWRFGATTADPDLWGHLTSGLETLGAGGYVSVDRWSYLTQGQPWINHPWLGQAVMAAIYVGLDSAGLVALKAALALGVVATLVWRMIAQGLEPVRVALLGLLIVLVLTPTFGTLRPQIFTVASGVVLMLVMVGIEAGKWRLLWVLPPLFLLWTNLHGGYLAGLAVLGTWAVIHAWRDRGRPRYAPLAGLLGALLASLVNPQGWRWLAFLLETATVARPEIQDWQPIDLASVVGIAYLVLAATVVASLTLDRTSVNWALGVPLLALTLAPLVAWRHLQLFAPAVVILGIPHIKRFSDQVGGRVSNWSPGRREMRAIAGVLVATVVLSAVGLGTYASCIRVESNQFEIPQRALVAWSTIGPEGNAVVPFNWGEYVRWHLGREVLVSTDGRRETIYSAEVHRANLDFMEGRDNWHMLLELAPADWILAPTAAPVVPLVEATGDWTMAYQDRVATLFSHDEVELIWDGETQPDGNGSCFPAGPTNRSLGDS